jgi:hypothetical protein
MKIAKAATHKRDATVNTSYDAVESAIDLAKRPTGNWERLAKLGRIKRWISGLGPTRNEEDHPSQPE